jgi:ribonuclease BN (tRNA processing enzyme)
MRVIWNGTGSAWAPFYGNSSAVVEAGGKRLLIDCGHTVPGRLRQMGLSLQDIDAVFVSHLHGDHVYGLEEWGFRSLLQWHIKPQLLIGQDLALPLWRHVLSGTMLRDYFAVETLLPSEPLEFGPFTLEIHHVQHVPGASAYGIKVRADGRTVAFTCDTIADIAPWFFADTDLVFHDCSFQPLYTETIHAHYEQIKRYPAEFRRKMFLVHYDDSLQERRDAPAFLADLAATEMRLTEPFVPIEIR